MKHSYITRITRPMPRIALVALAALAPRPAAAQAAASLSPAPRMQFFDSTGTRPLAGGCLQTFAAGSTTPLSTYSNAAGTPNTNPVILDSSGRADVWLGVGLAYKFTVRAKTTACIGGGGQVLYTADGIIDEGAALTQQLGAGKLAIGLTPTPVTSAPATAAISATTAGLYVSVDGGPPVLLNSASSIVYSQTTTYPAGSIGARLKRSVNVADAPYSADTTGATDATSAIQTAINALSTAGGGTLLFPFGSYLTGALTLGANVALQCAAGTNFLAAVNGETMFTVPAGVRYSGLSGDGGYCDINWNGKTGLTAIMVGEAPGTGQFTQGNNFANLLITGADMCIDTFNAFFGSFDNINCAQPNTAAFAFETNTTTTTCHNCSAIYTGGGPAPYCFLIHNNGTIDVTGKSTCQGNVTSLVYQSNNDNLDIYNENSGGTNTNPWIQVGRQNGTATWAINLSGSTFSVGANYAVELEQVSGLVIHDASFSTALGAVRVNNSGSANGTIRGVDIRGNNYDSGLYPASVIVFANGATGGSDLSNNLGTDSPDPQICIPVAPGTSITPPSAALGNHMGQGWCDGLTGVWNYEWKDGTGTIHRQITVSDATLSAISVWPNAPDLITGSGPNAIVATLNDATGNPVALVAFRTRIMLCLVAGTSLQAGANTLNLNGTGAFPILTNSGYGNLTFGYGNGSCLDMVYAGSRWTVLAQ